MSVKIGSLPVCRSATEFSPSGMKKMTERLRKEIASFLGVLWNDSLLHPTVNGRSAHANSMYKERQVTGVIRKSSRDKWRTVLTGVEQRIALNTRRKASRVGYDWNVSTRDALLLPFDRLWDKIKRSVGQLE